MLNAKRLHREDDEFLSPDLRPKKRRPSNPGESISQPADNKLITYDIVLTHIYWGNASTDFKGFKDERRLIVPLFLSQDNPAHVSRGTVMCFGMVTARLMLFRHSRILSAFPFQIGGKAMLQLRYRTDAITVLLPTTKEEIGMLDVKTASSLASLMTIHPTITFEPFVLYEDIKAQKTQALHNYPLNITVYGHDTKLHEVGAALSNSGIYLQEPPSFNSDFEYYNPHILSWSLDATPCFLASLVDSPMEFSTEIDAILNESASVDISINLTQDNRISTPLLPHQLAALQFMLVRECKDSIEKQSSMWQPEYRGLRMLFKHKITQIVQAEMTLPCRGGILADEMGMGKSLTLLALILHTLEEGRNSARRHRENGRTERETLQSSCATLIIAPKSTLYNWETQIKLHTCPGTVKVHLYHGPGTSTNLRTVVTNDIVLTTFETVSSDFTRSGALTSISWFRIVLDEAHHIRNRATRTFQAIENLTAERRWCLTGTPVQNGLDDLFSLTQFLRFHPLENHVNAQRYILEPLGRGDKLALINLRLAMQDVALRRVKSGTAANKSDKICIDVTLTAEERERYTFIRDNARQLTVGGKNAESQALLLSILYRRQICSHGEPSIITSSTSLISGSLGVRSRICNNCGDHIPSLHYTSREASRTCGHQVCPRCRLEESYNQVQSDSSTLLQCCVCQEPIIFTPEDDKVANGSSPEVVSHLDFSSSTPKTETALSSKLESVLNILVELDLERNSDDNQPVKSLVFSHWGKTLDCLESALRARKISLVRIDGSLRLEQRAAVMRHFQTDPETKIMLLTYASGSVGLNLAVATRVHLLEPHWNPMVEAQAAARVDRLDQKRDIVVYQYVVKQSIEEEILKRQGNKIRIAEASISKSPTSG